MLRCGDPCACCYCRPLRAAGGAKIFCCLRNGEVLAGREQMYSTLVMYGATGAHPEKHVSETGGRSNKALNSPTCFLVIAGSRAMSFMTRVNSLCGSWHSPDWFPIQEGPGAPMQCWNHLVVPWAPWHIPGCLVTARQCRGLSVQHSHRAVLATLSQTRRCCVHAIHHRVSVWGRPCHCTTLVLLSTSKLSHNAVGAGMQRCHCQCCHNSDASVRQQQQRCWQQLMLICEDQWQTLL